VEACPSAADGVNFPGSDTPNHAYVEIFDEESTARLGAAADWSFLVWIRVDNLNQDDRAIISQWDFAGGHANSVLMRTDQGGGAQDIELYTNGTPDTGFGAVSVDTWYLFGAVHDDTSGDITRYLYGTDCVQDATATDAHDGATGGADLVLGIDSPDADHFDEFSGDMAYALYVEGTALTQTEVESYCSDPCAEQGDHDGNTVFFYPFGSTDTYSDFSSAGNDATAKNNGTGSMSTNSSGGPYD
jgi:hypothetical protein